jgi:hypothetical protein
MNKYIVITTINSPTEATKLFCQKKDWQIIIVGDTKTPEAEYRELESTYSNVEYLSPQQQEDLYKDLSDAIGWRTIQRRNIGFLHAYNKGADILATVDDDNIPYESWGTNLLVNTEAMCDYYETDNEVFDPLSVTNYNYLWHRGVPIELLQKKNNVTYCGKVKRKVLIQADLWDGDPDIDAMARLTYKPLVKFNITEPYCCNKISPFNSQNTFIAREVIPFYTVIPFIGRMDDIWSSYLVQMLFKDNLVYAPATVYQDRNIQDLITNLEKEVIGYRNTLKFIRANCDVNSLLNGGESNNSIDFFPQEAREFLRAYRSYFA